LDFFEEQVKVSFVEVSEPEELEASAVEEVWVYYCLPFFLVRIWYSGNTESSSSFRTT
jgi:hypothetical protein